MAAVFNAGPAGVAVELSPEAAGPFDVVDLEQPTSNKIRGVSALVMRERVMGGASGRIVSGTGAS